MSFRSPVTAHTYGLQEAAPSPPPHPAEGDPRRPLSGGFHELLAAAPGDEAAALAFALSLAARAAAQTGKSVCFCGAAGEMRERGQLYGHGLAPLGVPPDRMVMVTARNEKDLLWTLEEAVVSEAFGAVAGALPAGERLYGFAASRRLKLRATARAVPLFLVRSWSCKGATAAHGRWRVGALQSRPEEVRSGVPLLGPPRLRLDLERMGGLPPQQWEVVFQPSASQYEDDPDVSRNFHLAPLLADGPARTAGGPRHRAA